MADGSTTRRDPHDSDWAEIYRSLVRLPVDELDAADLERLAVAAHLHGDDETGDAAWQAAYERHLASGEQSEAGRCAFWLALGLMLRGRVAHAGGWFGRAQSTVQDQPDCPAAGYLLVAASVGALESGETDRAGELARQARRLGARHEDPDLDALAILSAGQALLACDEIARGVATFDEVMLSVVAGEVGPIASGIVYCAVILECMHMFDLARASEWTDALDRWCRSQPDLVPYRGQCLVHQSQLHQASGDWTAAADAADLACRRLGDPPHPALGLAHYQSAELHRLRGRHDAALEAYRRAMRCGHASMPGLALLHFDRGELDLAASGIRRGLAESTVVHRRAPLLAAGVEVLLAAGDHEAASAASRELNEMSQRTWADVLQAMADHAAGAIRVNRGDMAGGLRNPRSAAATWRRLAMPYEAARSRVLIGLACSALGDGTSAMIELEEAHAAFAALGAQPDLDRLARLRVAHSHRPNDVTGRDDGTGHDDRGGLSRRELEVLTHVAAGRTSPEIAEELMISPHTVRRHLANIFAKFGVNSRAAATAHAYEHDLL